MSKATCFVVRVLTQIADVVDYILDPATVIDTLAKNNMTTMESVLRAYPPSLLQSITLKIHNSEFDVF